MNEKYEKIDGILYEIANMPPDEQKLLFESIKKNGSITIASSKKVELFSDAIKALDCTISGDVLNCCYILADIVTCNYTFNDTIVSFSKRRNTFAPEDPQKRETYKQFLFDFLALMKKYSTRCEKVGRKNNVLRFLLDDKYEAGKRSHEEKLKRI